MPPPVPGPTGSYISVKWVILIPLFAGIGTIVALYTGRRFDFGYADGAFGWVNSAILGGLVGSALAVVIGGVFAKRQS